MAVTQLKKRQGESGEKQGLGYVEYTETVQFKISLIQLLTCILNACWTRKTFTYFALFSHDDWTIIVASVHFLVLLMLVVLQP